jgi:hypothetical protein
LVPSDIADIERRFGRKFFLHYPAGAEGITFREKIGDRAMIQEQRCRIITAKNWVQTHDIP